MRRLYLLLAIMGFVLPYYFFIAFLLENGLDLGLIVSQLFENRISVFFAVDLIISAVVFLVFSYVESNRLGIRNWWVFLISTLMIGPSFALPLFLYFRHALVPSQE